MWFPRQEYWNGLPFLSPGSLPPPSYQSHVSCIDRQIRYHWEALEYIGLVTANPKASSDSRGKRFHLLVGGTAKLHCKGKLLQGSEVLWPFFVVYYNHLASMSPWTDHFTSVCHGILVSKTQNTHTHIHTSPSALNVTSKPCESDQLCQNTLKPTKFLWRIMIMC